MFSIGFLSSLTVLHRGAQLLGFPFAGAAAGGAAGAGGARERGGGGALRPPERLHGRGGREADGARLGGGSGR